jgi:hypothetical protein
MPCAPSKPSPLKNALGTALEVVVVRTDGPGGIDGHIRDIVNRLKALPKDAVAMAVGHTNTIGLIIKGVSGRNIDRRSQKTSSTNCSLSPPSFHREPWR